MTAIRTFIFLNLTSIISFAQLPNFDARGLIYLRDADYNVSTKQSHQIEKKGIDLVGLFTLPLNYSESRVPSEQSISNSVLKNHRPIAHNKEINLIYILETAGPVAGLNSTDSELEPGAFISVINISNPKNIRPEYRFPVADNPNSISLDPSFKYLAVSSDSPGNEIQVFELESNGKPLRLLPSVTGFSLGAVHDLIWHPSGDYLIYIKRQEKEMGLIKIIRNMNEIIRLDQFGEVLKFEGDPITGEYSNDGHIFYVLDKGDPENMVRGQVFGVGLSFDENQRHSFMSKATTGLEPISLSVHPGNKYILVSNSNFSEKANYYGESSLSVLSVENNMLINRLNYSLDGIWPSTVKFDKTGKNFAISFFRSREYGKPIGKIGFYSFEGGTSPKIITQAAQINTQSGTHHISVIF